ncbi:MAG: hypothetical protein LBU22_06545 [Dysgonamonadaceae bacterium]|jgi:hypothetical protein|nr:hypothetical protein [Dysgonamonadaceae bacterium]
MTSKSVQSELQKLHSELYYELSTPVYSGEINKTVYLNPLKYSNMEVNTSAKKKGLLIVPLLLFNHTSEKFDIILGTRSLIQPYQEFLMDALLVECNRSACFNLEEADINTLPDSTLLLDVEILKNHTTSRINMSRSWIIIPLNSATFNFYFSGYNVKPADSELEIKVRLLQKDTCLWEKSYFAELELANNNKGIDDLFHAYHVCLTEMTECLSLTTKEIVENISRDLHFLLQNR